MKPGDYSMGVIMGMPPKPQPPKNPMEELKRYERKQPTARAKKDLELWQRWDQSGRNPKDLAPLIRRFTPFIESRAKAWKPPHVPEAAFRDEIKKKLYQAAHTYKPEKASISTHFFQRAAAATRFGKRRANTMYIPEQKARHINRLNAVQDDLRDSFGRDPTHSEIHQHLNKTYPKNPLRLKDVKTIMEANRKDVLSSSFESDPEPRALPRHAAIAGPLLREAISVEYLRGMKRKRDAQKSVNEALRVYDMMYDEDGNPTGKKPGEIAKAIGKHPSHVSRIRTKIMGIGSQFV